ncbi:Ig-like domain-containing protein, partial [Candidatus Marithioploca araucensis]|nr:Ig-like domain-containing protein [Candidatus Marithioploca araucensis]
MPIIIITEAKFFRVGDNLEIKNLEDSWIIQDYFIQPVPIKTIDGLMSVDDVISKLSYHSEPILLAAESTTDLISSDLEQIGIITVAVENVSAESQDGTIRSLKVGEPVYLHETILTKTHSYVKITLNDGTVFQLGTHSRARLDKYSYDPDESDGGEFESYVSSGTFRYISGKISGHDQGQHTTIKTPSIQINIRGSDIDAQINADGSTTILHLSGFISIISQYHLREILVYERGTSVHIPNQDISYRIKTLTEDEIQVKLGEKWQIIDHLDPPQNEILDLEPKDISMVSPDVGAYNPFSSGNLDVNEGKLVDELRSIDETSQVEASEEVIVNLEEDDTLNTPEVTFSSPLNIFPSLFSMEVTLDEDNPKEISVEAGNLTQFSQPAHGEVVNNGDGTLTYNPNLNFNGEDSFTYTLNEIDSVFVKLIINAVNDPPVVVDDIINTDEDISLNLSEKLLENDFDVDEGDSISIVSVSDLTHGTVSLNESGDFVYQPEQDFYGLAEFVYTIEDSQGEQSTGSVKVNVSPVNDAPVAVDDVFVLETETSLIISADSLSKNDRDVDNDNDALKVIEVLNPSNGDVSLSDGEIVFSFKDNTVTTGGFEYTVSDGEKTDVGQVSINRYAGEDDEP